MPREPRNPSLEDTAAAGALDATAVPASPSLDATAAPTNPSLDATAAAASATGAMRAGASNPSLDATAAAASATGAMRAGASNASLDATAAASSNPSLDATAAASSNPSRDATVAPASDSGERRNAATAPGGQTPRIRPSRPSLAPELAGDLEVGSRVGRYLVTSKLGAGGMGVVLAAYDPELDRKVAIKLVRPDGGDGDGLRARMVREAQAMARLAHPNVLAVFDVGTVGASVFVAMELVEGETLGAWLGTPRSRRDVLRVFDQAGRGLAAAHAAGLVHRDFKPDNVMIGKDGRVRVMDFGLARQAEPTVREELPVATRASALSIDLTHVGALLGTPVYMAPEQWAGEPADARSDQYAFCVALWEALYGVRPFTATTIDELKTKVTGQPPEAPPAEIKLPRRVGGALRRGLAKDPAARFPSLEALLAELAAEPRARRRLAFAAAGAGLLGAGVIVSSLALRTRRETGAGCDDPQVQLAHAWDTPRKTAVHDALLATKQANAAETWGLLEHVVDGKAADYVRVVAPTCRGDYQVPAHLRAAQTACLARVKAQLAAYSDVLAGIKPAELAGAVSGAWGIDDAARCADPAVLAARTPPPADPKLAAQVAAVSDAIAKAQALMFAGRGKEALAAAEHALADAQQLDFPAARAEAQWLVGSLAGALGDAKRAEALLAEAFTALLAAGDDAIAASAAIRLAKLVGYDKQRPKDARQWLDQAGALIKRLGSPPDIEAERLSAESMIRFRAGDFAGARTFDEQSLAIKQKLRPDDPRQASTLQNIAGVLMETGDVDGALEVSRRALALTRKSLGENHPFVAEAEMNLGLILGRKELLEEALADERAALALYEKLVGPDDPAVVVCLFNLGSILFQAKQLPEARDVAQRALALSVKLNGDDHPDTADANENLGDVVAALGDTEQARTLYGKTLAIRSKVLEPGHPDIKRAEDELAALPKPRHRK